MMSAAREALAEVDGRRPLLIGVTVLTSMGDEDLMEIGVQADPQEQVLRLAKLAQGAGLDGVVCSPREAGVLRTSLGDGFALVTPGVVDVVIKAVHADLTKDGCERVFQFACQHDGVIVVQYWLEA